jgi:alkanesulfonate monooxygenase SsuD/methylene tetrahydromethanopterin reductase-like flavin-dependent oxidoreductase (luciferase family)
MKLGMFMMPLHPPGRNATETLAEDREAIILADKLGFAEAFVGEHVTDLAENVTSCLMFLASVASETKNIVLGSGTINMPNSHPANIAAQVAMLDHILKGRFIMGISPGGLMSDAEVFGNFQKNRNAMFVESINMVLKIWESEGPLDLQGILQCLHPQDGHPRDWSRTHTEAVPASASPHRRYGCRSLLAGRDGDGEARLASDLRELPVAGVGEDALAEVRGRARGGWRKGVSG